MNRKQEQVWEALDRQWETIRAIVDEYTTGVDDIGPYVHRNPMQARWAADRFSELDAALDAFERLVERIR